MPDDEIHERFMRRAIALSRKGYPAPNPHVGCVIARNGKIIGEGHHDFAGGPHAEVVALRQAGADAEGADVYVTLEPCNHSGRTGPCSRALLEAKVGRVFIACLDPNPVARGGLAELALRGVETHDGLLADAAALVNERFLTAMRLRRPYIVVKSAASLDGRVALPSGESKWITSASARRAGRRLRAEMGAVLVGRRTVVLDNPRLTARTKGSRNEPVRVVLDPKAKLKGTEAIFSQNGGVLQVVADPSPFDHRQIGAPLHAGEFHLPELMATLFKRGLTGLLVEGGPATVASFFRAGLVDRVELFFGPMVLGAGLPWILDLGLEHLADAPRLHLSRVRRIGPDLWITARPDYSQIRPSPSL